MLSTLKSYLKGRLSTVTRPLPRRSNVFITAVIGGAYFLVIANITLVIPLLAFIRTDLNLSGRESGLILAAFPTIALVANVVLGPFIDKFGRKRFLFIGAVGCAATFLLTAMSSNVLTISLCRAATGIFMPMIGASVFAAVGDYFAPSERVRSVGYVSGASSIAQLVAIPLSILIGGALTWRAPLIAFAAYSVVLAGLVAALPRPGYQVLAAGPVTLGTYRRKLLSFSDSFETRLAILAYFIYSTAIFAFLGLYPTWVMAHGSFGTTGTVATELFFFGGLGGLCGAVLSGNVAKRFQQPLRLCSLLSALTGVVMLVVPIAGSSFVLQMMCYGGFSFGRAMLLPVLIAATMLLVAPTERGSLNGMLNAIFQGSAAIGGVVSAWLYDLAPSFSGNAVASFSLFFAAAVTFLVAARKRAPSSETEHSS